jgi:flagellar biogenesis protein FliO
MDFAASWPARPRSQRSKALLRRLVPGLLLGAGALLLTQPWRGAGGASSPLVAPATAPAAPIPSSLDPASIAGALLVVGGLLFLLPPLLQRLNPAVRGRGRIDVLEARPLGGRRQLLLVQVDQRRFLIGASEAGLAHLADLDEPHADFARELEVATERAG